MRLCAHCPRIGGQFKHRETVAAASEKSLNADDKNENAKLISSPSSKQQPPSAAVEESVALLSSFGVLREKERGKFVAR